MKLLASVALLLASGCGRFGLLDDPGTPAPVDAAVSPLPQDAGEVMPPWDATDGADAPQPLTSRFLLVRSTITPTDGSAPRVHQFTIVFAERMGPAHLGSATGGGTFGFFEGPAGTLSSMAGQASFRLGSDCDDYEIIYQTMTFTRLASGALTGVAQGLVRYPNGNLIETTGATMALETRPDTEPPTFGFGDDADPTDPFTHVQVLPSEPLPADAVPRLTSAHGESFAMPLVSPGGGGPPHYAGPPSLLRFGEAYQVDPSGVRDFAGNDSPYNLTFTTRPAPAFLVEDGFESAKEEDLGGARLLAGAGTPVISGVKSFYVPPMEHQPSSGGRTIFALRLNVANGDTFIRFSYRTVDVPAAEKYGIATAFGVGTVGQSVGWSGPFETNQPKTPYELPDHTRVLVGPLYQAKILLPTGVSGEVFVAGNGGAVTCLQPRPPLQGIIIDDVRTE